MGLIKNKILDNGLEINYWGILKYTKDKFSGDYTYYLCGYKSKDVRDSNPKAYGDKYQKTIKANLIDENKDIIAQFYPIIMESILIEQHNEDESISLIETNFFIDAESDETPLI